MKSKLNLLIEQLKLLNFDIRSEKGLFQSSVCQINSRNVLLINKNDDDSLIEEVIINALLEYEKSDIYLMPAIRDMLENKKVSK